MEACKEVVFFHLVPHSLFVEEWNGMFVCLLVITVSNNCSCECEFFHYLFCFNIHGMFSCFLDFKNLCLFNDYVVLL